MDTVFLALDLFSHISDALRGEFIKALSKKYNVIVLTKYLDEEAALRGGYSKSDRVHYHKLTIRHRRLWDIFNRYIRHAFVRAYDGLYVTQYYYYRSDHPFVIRFLAGLGSFLPREWAGTRPFTFFEGIFAKPTNEFQVLVEKHKPVLMITARPGLGPFEAEMIHFAKRSGIPTVAINLNYDNPQSVAKFYRNTDYVLVWNPYMKQQMEQLHGYPRERVFVAGCLRFDHYFTDIASGSLPNRESFLKSKNLDPLRKTVVYATPTPVMYPPRKEFFRILLDLKRSGALRGDPNILIRLHPHDVLAPYEGWEQTAGVWVERAGHQRLSDSATKGQKVEMEEDDLVNLTATLAHADVVLVFASTVAIEATIFDKPAVSIGFPKKEAGIYWQEYNKAMIESGATRLAESHEDLKMLINRYLENPLRDRDQRRALFEKFVLFNDGRSHERAARLIDEIVSRIKSNTQKTND